MREENLIRILEQFGRVIKPHLRSFRIESMQEREILLLELWDKIQSEADVIRLKKIIDTWEE